MYLFFFLRPSLAASSSLQPTSPIALIGILVVIMLRSHHYQTSIASLLRSTIIIGITHTIAIILANWFENPACLVTFLNLGLGIWELGFGRLSFGSSVCCQRWLLWKVMACVLRTLLYNSPVQGHSKDTRGSFFSSSSSQYSI